MTMLYEGKAKQIFSTDNPNEIIIHYKDDATAGNGAKKGTIVNKGVINNKITAIIYSYLESKGVKTHLIEVLNDRDQLCRKVEIVPLEVICRNMVAGSASVRYKIEEGTTLNSPIYEICWKRDDLGDPLINDYHAIAFNLATEDELKKIYKMTDEINIYLSEMWHKLGIILVDFKIEFGRTSDGEIVLADEISPDTCRLWDEKSHEKLDKDRFRRDLGNIEDAYIEILRRLKEL
ncbi:MAG: phosphoribosylaminoimidazolesuccinocarboxamide synthase [Erysipelotrichaceae bacterium]